MQKTLLILIVVFSCGVSFAQPRVIFMNWKNPVIRAAIEHLDSTHLDACINGSTPDSKDCVFGGQADTVIACFETYLHQMHKAIIDHGIVWEDSIHFWTRGYFNERGEVDAIVVHVADSLSTPQLAEAITDFAQKFRWGMTGPRPFAQCGGTMFKPK
ncbi:MAG TPA: hypothetical protein VFJ29_02360 [Candidatus Kapabacteria bacterium]|nr:hypothetical protein [Candidatus Kapabacteria bacterium]